ncbi:hypothetical protein BDQ17DRAFT_1333767 [Cyathus striatus]|nr:hypothetical protein BDQ17DRAFT_1333767 [Cyathus striatus]
MPHKHNCTISSPSESGSDREDGMLDDEDVEEEHLPMHLEIVIPSPDASKKDLQKGLRSAQLKVLKLYNQLKKVNKEKAILEAAKSGTRHWLHEIWSILYMYEVWMCSVMQLTVVHPDPDLDDTDWNSAERYSSPKVQLEGI